MAMSGRFQLVPVGQIRLDETNPRIAAFLEQFPTPHTAEQVYLALGAGADDGGGGLPSFHRLKQAILTSEGIINPVILRTLGEDSFSCIEGNTRVALYREFKDDGLEGDWDTIPAIVHTEVSEEDVHAIRLQAHLVGPRPWTPYAKAKYLTYLRNAKHFEFARLVDFCGGNERSIREALEAFADIERYYRPQLESDEDFDVERFSGFVELQKPGVKEAILQAGFSLNDFAKWIIDGKIIKLAHVRSIPKVLRDQQTRSVFLKSGIEEALRSSDAPDLSKTLQEASLSALARGLTEAVRRIEYREVRRLRDDPASSAAQALVEAYEELRGLMADIGAESE
jgi:hypothetical protein